MTSDIRWHMIHSVSHDDADEGAKESYDRKLGKHRMPAESSEIGPLPLVVDAADPSGDSPSVVHLQERLG